MPCSHWNRAEPGSTLLHRYALSPDRMRAACCAGQGGPLRAMPLPATRRYAVPETKSVCCPYLKDARPRALIDHPFSGEPTTGNIGIMAFASLLWRLAQVLVQHAAAALAAPHVLIEDLISDVDLTLLLENRRNLFRNPVFPEHGLDLSQFGPAELAGCDGAFVCAMGHLNSMARPIHADRELQRITRETVPRSRLSALAMLGWLKLCRLSAEMVSRSSSASWR